jgi:hypothetical protein
VSRSSDEPSGGASACNGSIASFWTRSRDVRLPPDSGARADILEPPLRANRRHSRNERSRQLKRPHLISVGPRHPCVWGSRTQPLPQPPKSEVVMLGTVIDGIIGISEGAISNGLHQPNRSAFAVARARVAASCAICAQSPV